MPKRKQPGSGSGKFFRIELKSKQVCKPRSFRTHALVKGGSTKRLACKSKKTGKWITKSFLFPKDRFDNDGGVLIPRKRRTEKWFTKFVDQHGFPTHVKGDVFKVR